MALVCAAIALVSVFGVGWIGAQSKRVPYLVEVDRSGNAVVGHEARTTEIDDNLLRALCAGFVESWRSVYVDAAAEHTAVDQVYAHLSSEDPACNTLNAWFRENNPYKRAGTESVTVTIKSVLQTAANMVQVEWEEEKRDRKGYQTGKTLWKASMKTAISQPTKEEEILRNPTGLFVQELTFSEELNHP